MCVLVAARIAAMETATRATQTSIATLAAIDAAQAALVEEQNAVRGFVATGDPGFLQRSHGYGDDFKTSMTWLRDLSERDAVLAARIARLTRVVELVRIGETAQVALAQTPATRDMARRSLITHGRLTEARKVLAEMRAVERTEITALQIAQARAVLMTKWLLAAGGLLSVALSIVVGLLLTRAIAGPILAMTRIMGRLASGDHTVMVPALDRRDEIGWMARAVQTFKDAAIRNQRLEAAAAKHRASAERARRAIEAERLRTAELAAEAKSAFLANMSHEFRTPLTAVVGFARLLAERPDLPGEARNYAGRISDASEALLTLINDVLDFSKLEAEQVQLEIQPLSVSHLAEQSIGLVAIQAAAKGIDVALDLDPATPSMISGDVARLRQILLNLLSNAVKFTDQGSVTVRTIWTPRRKGGRLRVSVVDTGAGISPEGQRRLFQRFSQAEVSTNRTHGGTGLGLAISKALVELMGGRIGVTSTPAEGSTFWFEIPTEAAHVAPMALETAADFNGGHIRLLVADDTPVNRELIRLMLTPLGVEVEEAANGAEAVTAAAARPFDLILMDVRMPGMDGMEATRRIRAAKGANRKTPILALTADVQPEHAAAYRKAGMNDLVAKPIAPRELLAAISRWTGEVEASSAVVREA